jgi:hypothetical protein
MKTMAVLVDEMFSYILKKNIKDHLEYPYRVQVIKNRVVHSVIPNVRLAFMVLDLFAGTNAMENIIMIVGSIVQKMTGNVLTL